MISGNPESPRGSPGKFTHLGACSAYRGSELAHDVRLVMRLRSERPQTRPWRSSALMERVLNKKGGEASTPQHRAQTLLLHKNIFGGDLLSHTPTGCSTISAKSLNYRVRNETGCTPLAITTEKPSTTTTPPTVQPGNLKQHTPQQGCYPKTIQ